MVNETMQVVSYQQAALWDTSRGIVAVSGAARPEKGAPYVRWVRSVAAHLGKGPPSLRPVGPADLPPALAAGWAEWLPAHALWCPLSDNRGPVAGGLLFARPEPWEAGDRDVVAALSGAYAQSWILARLPRRSRPRLRGRYVASRVAAAAILGCVVAAGFVPVRESVLAPAEIVPARPALVRAPFAGVIETLEVAPNAKVREGQVLLTMNRRQLVSQQQVATKALEMARAEYAQASQEAMTDPKARARTALLRSKIDEQQAELAYQNQMLARAVVKAPADGYAVYNDPSEWVGKPVETGERVMLVAPESSRRLEIQVPVSEAVTFSPGAEATFFDNVDPDRPWHGRVDFASYGSAMTPDGIMAYSFRADLDTPAGTAMDGLRLGLKGTAKIFGEPRPLALWILRKPIMVVRQWLAA